MERRGCVVGTPAWRRVGDSDCLPVTHARRSCRDRDVVGDHRRSRAVAEVGSRVAARIPATSRRTAVQPLPVVDFEADAVFVGVGVS